MYALIGRKERSERSKERFFLCSDFEILCHYSYAFSGLPLLLMALSEKNEEYALHFAKKKSHLNYLHRMLLSLFTLKDDVFV